MKIATTKRHINRLQKLAIALLQLELNNPGKKYLADENNSIEHFDWALVLVPKLWDTEPDIPDSPDKKRYDILYRAANYFSLTMDECMHLFAPGYQETFYYGGLLPDKITAMQLSQHIADFIELKMEYAEPEPKWKTSGKEKQVLTFKNDYHEERQYANYMS